MIRLALTLLALLAALPAQAFDTTARAAWVYDLTTQTVLLDKNATAPIPPASMSKLMTVNMLFEALQDGRVTLDTRFAVSDHAHAQKGSSMFLNQQDRPTVEELIKGLVVLSGNDAAVVVAEGLSGSEAEFARKMTERAPQIGLKNSHFANSNGMPDPGQMMTAEDLGRLAVRLITQFPDYYGYFGLTEFPYDGRTPDNRFNRNPLLRLGIGADGLKTGHTSEAGYGLVGSAVQNGRRIVFVISGLESDKARAQEAEKIVNWAFRQFVLKTVAPKGTRLAAAPVFNGAEAEVGLTVAQDVALLMPAEAQGALTAEALVQGPVPAPVEAGAALGELVLTAPGMAETRVPLVAEAAVEKGGFLTHLGAATSLLRQRLTAAPAGS